MIKCPIWLKGLAQSARSRFGGGKSTNALTNFKDFFGDLFLLGLLALVFVAWRRFGERP